LPERSDAEEHLLTVLAMVNDWLKFAEAKNAGLIALAGLSLTGLLSYVAQVNKFIYGAAILLVAGAVLWLGSLMLGMFSFMPQRTAVKPKTPLREQVDDTDNLYYFGHLASYSSETLLVALNGNEQEGSLRERFVRNLADQVIINSRITVNKLDLFDLAARWWVAGTFFVSAGVLWLVIGKR